MAPPCPGGHGPPKSYDNCAQWRWPCAHEATYLLAEGSVPSPAEPIPDVIDWKYTGNRLHPTQEPVGSLQPIIRSFCPEGGRVLDPFCGSSSTLVAARKLGRNYLGIEIKATHHQTAHGRLMSSA